MGVCVSYAWHTEQILQLITLVPFMWKCRTVEESEHKTHISRFLCVWLRKPYISKPSPYRRSFIAAYRRSVARRGVVRHIYSDNGTNFVLANKILQENLGGINSFDARVSRELPKSGTNWHFSPAGSPHFNGLAVAAVKTVKSHIKKTVAESKLSFEELCTLLAQIGLR